ncbi:MAG: RraA family protein [Rhodospirillales bacterium]|jgi:4-hydroxy-4-methyl-2-oxoglutarate aldolase|nr:RraA family protein [Rhodospirillales bacterium]
MAETSALTIHRGFNRADPELVKALCGYPSGYFADIQGRRGAMDFGIRPMFHSAAFVGSALTIKSVPDDNLACWAALDVIQPGDVVVIACGGWTGSAVIGDLTTGMYKNAGASAAITDGMVRDVEGLEQVGLPIYARGLTPNSPQKFGPGEIGGEISIGGLTVRSGDIVIGDRDGIVVLPQDRFASAVADIKGVQAKEAIIEKAIAAGDTKPQWVKEFLAGEGVQNVE